ncbi:MAG: nucleotidyl transferase AbiEii/AbiGii toxin family protein [Oligoflexia bacterium]|nr:nucleotidyl transferase AbiEii/AbiGii toxin family protein [Oligoflexia bacterium]
MLTANRDDSIHKAWLLRILMHVADDVFLMEKLRFKGGTCAAMRGIIDRFSVDLDFDIVAPNEEFKQISLRLEAAFKTLDLKIKDKNDTIPQYFLRYKTDPGKRCTIKIDMQHPVPVSNQYEKIRFTDIDRIIPCQTVETMFANKLVAVLDRYEKQGGVAARDIYDVHSFFLKGCGYSNNVIIERTNQPLLCFFKDLKLFIEQKVTGTVIEQDLNLLLPPDRFKQIKKTLKNEVIVMINDEIQRLEQ